MRRHQESRLTTKVYTYSESWEGETLVGAVCWFHMLSLPRMCMHRSLYLFCMLLLYGKLWVGSPGNLRINHTSQAILALARKQFTQTIFANFELAVPEDNTILFHQSQLKEVETVSHFVSYRRSISVRNRFFLSFLTKLKWKLTKFKLVRILIWYIRHYNP